MIQGLSPRRGSSVVRLVEPDWLSEHVAVLPEDHERIDPAVWTQLAGCVEHREVVRVDYQTFAFVWVISLTWFHPWRASTVRRAR